MTAADIQAIRDALAAPWNEPDRSADAEVQRLYKLCQRADDAIARLLAALEDAQRQLAMMERNANRTQNTAARDAP